MPIQVSKSVLEEAANNADIWDEDIRFNYSGRGMYGRACFGIVGTTSSLISFVASVTRSVVEWEESDRDDEHPLTAFFYSQIENVSTDNMAFDYIFYWPSVEVVD